MAVAEAPAEQTVGRPAQTGAAIRAKALTKKYGDFTAVDKLDLTVNHGEIYGLLGPNGAGKTTTILMLLGLSEPSGGTARVLDYDPALNPTAVKRRVGYLPDNVGFYSGMTGRQNLRYTARLNRVPKAEAEDRIDALLQRVGLPEAGDKKVETYSRGMRQRLGLADVLVKEPSIIILDEPTTAIDPAGVEEVLELVRQLADEGAAILLASHLLHQVQQVCDRVGIFVSGKLVASGTTDKLAAQAGTGPIEIEVIAAPPLEAVKSAIQKVSGVTKVASDMRDKNMLVVTANRDVRAEVARALVEAGHPPYHLRRRGDELDEVYRRYFAAYEPTGAAE
ncbi:MAG TPA: ABC transporter ATP-binding protein [Candidatus Limnocylindrales bacterium]|jgi:ABC-2 type transport system ATP-binding protein